MKKTQRILGQTFFTRGIILLIVVLCLVPFQAFAAEAGLIAATKVSLKDTTSTVLSVGERLDGWWKIPFGVNGSLFEGSAHFDYSLYADDDPTLSSADAFSLVPSGDLDRARLAFVLPSPTSAIQTMNVEFGRLRFWDPTGLIVSHPADGALLGIVFPLLKFDAQAGWLILRNANSIAVSLYDQTASEDTSRVFGNSRLLVRLGLDFPNLGGQSVTVSFLAQQDMNPESGLIDEWPPTQYEGGDSRGGKVNTQYSTISASGPLAERFFYDVWFTYGSGKTLSWLPDDNSTTGYSYQYAPISSMMAGFSFDYYMPAMLSSAVNLRFLYASGDADYDDIVEGNTEGDGTQFIPLTPVTLGTVFSPMISNLIVAELGGTVKPFSTEPLQMGLKMLAFFRPPTGPVDASGILSGSDSPWLGFETDFSGNYRIMSDLGLSLNVGAFLPGVSPQGAFDMIHRRLCIHLISRLSWNCSPSSCSSGV